jgi:RHS repeat-associated protein
MDGRSGNFGSGDARYKYTTKERDVESGYDYFGARYYDSRIGRWMSVDPKAKESPESSPYLYVADNPLRGIDPDGAGVWEAIQGYATGLVVNGPANFIGGIANLPAAIVHTAIHPVQTLQAIGSAAQNSWSTVTAPSSPSNDFARGEAIGEIAFNVVAAVATVGIGSETGVAGTASEQGSIGIKVAESSEAGTATTATVAQPAAGGQFIVSPGGIAVKIPAGYSAEIAENGKGVVFRPAGSTGNANTIRIMDSNKMNPKPYVRIFDEKGQPIDPVTGKPTSNALSHTPLE